RVWSQIHRLSQHRPARLRPRLRRVPRAACAAFGEHPRRDPALRQDPTPAPPESANADGAGAVAPATGPGGQPRGLRGGRTATRSHPATRGRMNPESPAREIVPRAQSREPAVETRNVIKCQFCSNEATVHLTDIVSNQKREIHLCQSCAESQQLIKQQELNLS